MSMSSIFFAVTYTTGPRMTSEHGHFYSGVTFWLPLNYQVAMGSFFSTIGQLQKFWNHPAVGVGIHGHCSPTFLSEAGVCFSGILINNTYRVLASAQRKLTHTQCVLSRQNALIKSTGDYSTRRFQYTR